jgi:hypothetical protein
MTVNPARGRPIIGSEERAMLDRPEEPPRSEGEDHDAHADAPDWVQIPTHTAAPDFVRSELLAEVRRRLLRGEIDSERALWETALALLDSDAIG